MKTLVLFTSQTGFTKKYAEWLAERTGADLHDLKEVQKNDDSFFAGYDAIVYAGWVMAGKVAKMNWFLDRAKGWQDKQLALIAVGGGTIDAPETETAMKGLLTEEQSAYIKAFYCQGGFNYEKMNMASKLAMKAFVGSLKKSRNERSRELAASFDHSCDMTDIRFLDPVVEYLKEVKTA